MPALDQWDVTAEDSFDGAVPCMLLKIGCPSFEANFWIPVEDLAKLKLVRGADCIQIGRSAGAPAFWSRGEGGLVMVAIGSDDESWDICLGLPEDVFKEVLIEAGVFLDVP